MSFRLNIDESKLKKLKQSTDELIKDVENDSDCEDCEHEIDV